MRFSATEIAGVFVIEPERRVDERGFFVLEDAFDAVALAEVTREIDPIEERVTAFLRTREQGRLFIADAEAITFSTHLVTRSPRLRAFCSGPVFQGLVRDMQPEHGVLIVVCNFYQMAPEVARSTFEEPGDHADELETSMILHLRPELVELHQAGPGKRVPFAIKALTQPGVWTPRPWSRCHPDTGSGDPSRATASPMPCRRPRR